jgi:hypothetical protein
MAKPRGSSERRGFWLWLPACLRVASCGEPLRSVAAIENDAQAIAVVASEDRRT